MSDQNRKEARPAEAVGALVDTTLRLGVSVAQAVAEAATGKPQQTKAQDTHLQAIIRHGTTAAGSIIATVVSASRGAADVNGAAPDVPVPKVAPGATLRVPLSVDNPGTQPMENIAPSVVSLTLNDKPADDAAQVVFEPDTLTVGPNDFEKLVVFVSVADTASQGRYAVSFVLNGDEGAPISLAFEVVAPKSTST